MFLISSILPFLEKYFVGLGEALIGSQAAKSLEQGIVAFVKTDVGALAIDAVQYASTLTGSDTDLHAAAVAKFKTDLTAAGKDIETVGQDSFDLFIQAAYVYVKGTISQIKPPTLPSTPAPAPTPAAAPAE